jgi:hypothetical protein
LRLIALLLTALASGHSLGVPASSMTRDGQQVKYCVTGYAPDRVVKIAVHGSDTTLKLRTHISGSGCTKLPARSECGRVVVQSAVATGIGADGNPATSSAALREPSNPATCPPTTPATHHPSTAGGRVSLSGAGIALLSVLGIAVLGILGIGLAALRRRSKA